MEAQEERAVPSAEAKHAAEDGESEKKMPKKRFALVIAYFGAGYQGLQVNPSQLQLL